MTEKDRILTYTNGERPEGILYDVLHIKNIPNPKEDLEGLKQFFLTYHEHKHLHEEDLEWERLLPEKMVKFTDQLDEEDYKNDDLVSHIPSMIYDIKDLRKWEWYSSKLFEDGFELVFLNQFKAIFLPIIHHFGIPINKIYYNRNGREFHTTVYKDVLSYKTFNQDTFELK